MEKPKRNHPWRLSTRYRAPPPDEFYYYDDIDSLPIMSDRSLIEEFTTLYKLARQEDSYD